MSYHTHIPTNRFLDYNVKRDYNIKSAMFDLDIVADSFLGHLTQYNSRFVQFNVALTKSVGSLGFKKKDRRSYDGNAKMIAFFKTTFEPFLIKSILD